VGWSALLTRTIGLGEGADGGGREGRHGDLLRPAGLKVLAAREHGFVQLHDLVTCPVSTQDISIGAPESVAQQLTA